MDLQGSYMGLGDIKIGNEDISTVKVKLQGNWNLGSTKYIYQSIKNPWTFYRNYFCDKSQEQKTKTN